MKVFGQLESAQLEASNGAPSKLPLGRVYLDTATGLIMFYDGSSSRAVVTADNTQTLTNKTLTSPTINSPTISSPTMSAITVTGTGSITTGTKVVDPSSTTKQLAFALSGATASKTMTLSSSHTNDRTLSLPDITDTLVGRLTTDTISNKTLDHSNSARLQATGFLIEDFSDSTKLMKFDVSGVSTGTTRTLTVPNANITLVGTSATQSLTNKTIDFSNTVTLRSDRFQLLDSSDLTKGLGLDLSPILTGGTISLTVPNQNTTLVGRNTTDALTNKDYQGGTASDSSRFTIPKDTLANLTGLTRKQATVVYDTTGNQLLVDDGSNLNAIGSGSGEKNYIAAPSTAAGWAASGAGITVATDTTGSELPRPNTTKTGIKFTGVSGSTAYAYYRFILDDADASKKLKVQFDMKPGTAVAGDFRVDVYSNTANDYTTGNTRLALSTDVSAVSALPALTGTYRTAFDAPAVSAKYIELRIGMNASATHTLVLSDVIVGPGVVVQGAALSPAVAWTPTCVGMGTVTVNRAEYAQVGEYIEGEVEITAGTPTGVNATITLPNSWTTLATAGQNPLIGHWATNNSTAATVKTGGVIGDTVSSNFLYFSNGEYTPAISGTAPAFGNAIFAAGAGITLRFRVRISQLVGSSVANVVQNDISYYYGTGGTWGTSATLTTAQGQGGVLGGTSTPSGTSFSWTIVPTYPIPTGAKPVIEVSVDGTHFSEPGAFNNGSMVIERLRNDGTNYVGAGVYLNSSGNIVVTFGKYAFGTSSSWAGIWYWRVPVGLPGQAVGFSNVGQTSAGLIKGAGQLLGTNTNDDAATGYVGEVVTNKSSGPFNITSATWCSVDSGNASFNDGNEVGVALTPGHWILQAQIECDGAASTTMTDCEVAIGTGKGTSTTGVSDQDNSYKFRMAASTATRITLCTPLWSVKIASSTTYYTKAIVTFGTSTMTVSGRLTAIRIR